MLRLLASLFLMGSTYAYQQDLGKVPNGNNYGITLGHPGGATKKPTAFASSFYSAGQKWGKAFCQADTDGDGQSNGLEMGDPCCLWAVGKTPMITTTLSDPNSAASKTTRQMPTCVQTNMFQQELKQQALQCPVCIQALQLEMNKPSDNAADFVLLSIKSCQGSTQDDQQKVLCIKTLIKNADQLFNDQKNAVSPTQSCMNLGLTCVAPTQPPTTAPLPTTMAPLPTTMAPGPPLPPIIKYESGVKLPGPGVCACGKARYDVASCDSDECYKDCDLKNTGHGVCTTKKVNEMISTPFVSSVESTNSGTYMTIGITVVSTLAAVGVVWGISHAYKRSKKEPLIDMDDSFSELPDIDYKV